MLFIAAVLSVAMIFVLEKAPPDQYTQGGESVLRNVIIFNGVNKSYATTGKRKRPQPVELSYVSNSCYSTQILFF